MQMELNVEGVGKRAQSLPRTLEQLSEPRPLATAHRLKTADELRGSMPPGNRDRYVRNHERVGGN